MEAREQLAEVPYLAILVVSVLYQQSHLTSQSSYNALNSFLDDIHLGLPGLLRSVLDLHKPKITSLIGSSRLGHCSALGIGCRVSK